jgi:hypothetical protein
MNTNEGIRQQSLISSCKKWVISKNITKHNVLGKVPIEQNSMLALKFADKMCIALLH